MMLYTKSKCITKDDLINNSIRDILIELTDNDYNGKNGKEYYEVIPFNNCKMAMSKLDYELALINGEYEEDLDTVELIKRVLIDNYSDSYYNDYAVEVIKREDFIFVTIAYTED